MSQKIQVRRGTDSSRTAITPDQGEPIWTTDTNQLYIGNGTTAGGVKIGAGLQGDSYYVVVPNSGDTTTQNGTKLRNAIIDYSKLNPYGQPRSVNNWFSILLYPGIYNVTGNKIPIPRYTVIKGLGKQDSIINVSNGTDYGFTIGSGYVTIENVRVTTNSNIPFLLGDTPSSPLPSITGTTFKDIYFSGIGVPLFGNLVTDNYGMTIDNLSISSDAFFGVSSDVDSANVYNATIKNCRVNADYYMLDTSYPGIVNGLVIEECYFASPLIRGSSFGAATFTNSIIKNCYFSGLGTTIAFANSNATAKNIIIKDCTFEQIIAGSSPYTYDNCYFKDAKVNITSTPTYFPSFYNCRFMGVVAGNTDNINVTGIVGTSGLFVDCLFNRLPFSGATGLFGPQNSRYDVRYK